MAFFILKSYTSIKHHDRLQRYNGKQKHMEASLLTLSTLALIKYAQYNGKLRQET